VVSAVLAVMATHWLQAQRLVLVRTVVMVVQVAQAARAAQALQAAQAAMVRMALQLSNHHRQKLNCARLAEH
jgi:hypothetical protein